jgi:hypothetical protein
MTGIYEEHDTALVRQYVINGILCEVRRQEEEGKNDHP